MYLEEIRIKDYKSFKGDNRISLINNEGKLNQWTIIVGNNNAGKTNLLRIIADLEPTSFSIHKEEDSEKLIAIPQVFLKPRIKNIFEGIKGEFGCTFCFEKTKSSKSITEKKLNNHFETPEGTELNWSISKGRLSSLDYDLMKNIDFYGYGTSRRPSKGNKISSTSYNTKTLFDSTQELINFEEWLFQLEFASKNGRTKADKQLKLIKEHLFSSELFPDLTDFRFISNDKLVNRVEFKTTDGGWYKLEDLGYGYQTSISWIIDFTKKMIEKYPRSKNPLAEPAIVLIDEIDLHLHPKWQKKIVKQLSNIFTCTQFIATTHSPHILQEIDEMNLIVLKRKKDIIEITSYNDKSVIGWNISEILEEILEMDNAYQYSSEYNKLIKKFNEALDSDNYSSAKEAYNELKKIIHPNNIDNKLLKIQLSQFEEHGED